MVIDLSVRVECSVPLRYRETIRLALCAWARRTLMDEPEVRDPHDADLTLGIVDEVEVTVRCGSRG